jgi:hypothetical protein
MSATYATVASMKISLKLANGATLEFEGDSAEFERISEFLAEPPESLTAEAPPGVVPKTVRSTSFGGNDQGSDGDKLDPAFVAAQLEHVGAVNDQERVTVMGQLAVESGRDGVDYATLETLFSELALRKPAQFPAKTLSNARASGLMKKVKQGIWRPTYRGENFAKGLGRTERGQSRRSAARPNNSTRNEGGDSD